MFFLVKSCHFTQLLGLVVLVANFGKGIFLAAYLRPPPVKVVREGAGAYCAEAV